MPQDNSRHSILSKDGEWVPSPSAPGETGARPPCSITQSAFHTGCQRLDYTVRVQTAIGFVVTHTCWNKTLGKLVPYAETFLTLKEAREFHDSKGADAGMIVAIREDGSVIGEIPTPRQAAEILARARNRELDEIGERFAGNFGRASL